jgi:hypothetical protein
MKKYKYEGSLPPALYVSHITGKKYIVPAWIEVDKDTTLNQIEWTKPTYK